MKKLKPCSVFLFFAIVLMIAFISNDMAHAISLQVAPHRFVFRLDQSNAQEAVVTNISDRPVKFKIYAEMAQNQAQDQYLGDWVIIFPRLVSLNPGDQKVIRFSTRPPKNIKDGEYRAYLYFEELYEKSDEPVESENLVVDFQLLTKIGVNIYGQYGSIRHNGELKGVVTKCVENELVIQGNFENQGNAHLLTDVGIVIKGTNQQIVVEDEVKNFAVHRDVIENFEYRTEFSQVGKYTLQMVFKHEDKIVFTYDGHFEIN